LNGNRFYGNYFTLLGAGAFLVNARRNVVQNNHFVDLRNGGDPIRFRNSASSNMVDGGSFTYSGITGTSATGTGQKG
jgi:hypothetical protein